MSGQLEYVLFSWIFSICSVSRLYAVSIMFYMW